MNRRGQFQMLIIDREIVTIGRKWRSKWWTVKCSCAARRRRKDGTCKHERMVLENVRPELAGRVKIDLEERA